MSMDIVLIGVGGQGILTIGDLLTRAALDAGIPASFAPTKGMAQRGGFVKAELRLGAEEVGPRVRARGADLVIAMEQSEALKGLEYVKPGGTFLLFAHVWEPTGVQLGVDAYPPFDAVLDAIRGVGARPLVVRPEALPEIGGRRCTPNVFLLGTVLAHTPLGEQIGIDRMEQVIAERWPKRAEENLQTFTAGTKHSGGSIE